MKKEFGGLEIPDLRDLNLCLLGSWVKIFIVDEGKLWRGIVGRKYCRGDNIFYSNDRQTSTFWKGVVMATKVVKLGYRWVPGNGNKITFVKILGLGLPPGNAILGSVQCVQWENKSTLSRTRSKAG
jgi:hypothetical protein